MPRVKRGTVRRAKRKKLLARTKGIYATRASCIAPQKSPPIRRSSTPSSAAATRSGTSAACGSSASTPPRARTGLTYGQLINGLKLAGVDLDRKSLPISPSTQPAAFASSPRRPRRRGRAARNARPDPCPVHRHRDGAVLSAACLVRASWHAHVARRPVHRHRTQHCARASGTAPSPDPSSIADLKTRVRSRRWPPPRTDTT